MQLPGYGRSFTLMALTLALSAPAAWAQKQTEHVDRTVAFPAGGTLVLRNFAGDVHITATSGKDLVIKAVRSAERERLDHIKLEIETSGSTVRVDANKRDSSWQDRDKENVVETTFDIQIPASANLDIDVFGSTLDIKHVTGTLALKTFSGDITVTGAKGGLQLETFSGAIDVDAVAAGTSPSLSAETFSGRIHVKLDNNVKAEVDFDSHSGSFDSEIPLTLRATRGRTTGRSPGSTGTQTLRFHTFSGTVRVTK